MYNYRNDEKDRRASNLQDNPEEGEAALPLLARMLSKRSLNVEQLVFQEATPSGTRRVISRLFGRREPVGDILIHHATYLTLSVG
ncbi:MAG TPA: hypothetical protein VHA70_03670 [Bauldia sp.]|nr:hypothetical protein [Bauldia sp.]